MISQRIRSWYVMKAVSTSWYSCRKININRFESTVIDVQVKDLIDLYDKKMSANLNSIEAKIESNSNVTEARLLSMENKLTTLANIQEVRSKAAKVHRSDMFSKSEKMAIDMNGLSERIDTLVFTLQKLQDHMDIENNAFAKNFDSLQVSLKNQTNINEKESNLVNKLAEKIATENKNEIARLEKMIEKSVNAGAEFEKECQRTFEKLQTTFDDKIEKCYSNELDKLHTHVENIQKSITSNQKLQETNLEKVIKTNEKDSKTLNNLIEGIATARKDTIRKLEKSIDKSMLIAVESDKDIRNLLSNIQSDLESKIKTSKSNLDIQMRSREHKLLINVVGAMITGAGVVITMFAYLRSISNSEEK